MLTVYKTVVMRECSDAGALPDFLRELRIGYKEAGDPVPVEQLQKPVDLGVHYRLSHKRQCTVPDLHPLFKALRLEAWHA